MSKQALIVDDSRVARMALKKILLPHDIDIVEADSAEQALESLASASDLPDIIFMDVTMPGMDGLTATQQLKANPALAAIPVIICTGNHSDVDQQKAVNAGAQFILSKPPQAELVSDIIAGLQQTEMPQPEPVSEPAVPASPQIEQALIDSQIQTAIEVILPTVQQQLVSNITQQLSETVQPHIAQNLTVTLEAQTQQALASAVTDLDLNAQLDKAIAEQGAAWLTQQQSSLKTELQNEIEPKMIAAIEQQVSTSIADHVTPLMIQQQQMASEYQILAEQQQALAARLGKQTALSAILAIALIGLAAWTVLY